jgi:hypothetical protein
MPCLETELRPDTADGARMLPFASIVEGYCCYMDSDELPYYHHNAMATRMSSTLKYKVLLIR